MLSGRIDDVMYQTCGASHRNTYAISHSHHSSDKRTNHPPTVRLQAAPSHTKAFNYVRPLIIY